jgi:hypothetical protein
MPHAVYRYRTASTGQRVTQHDDVREKQRDRCIQNEPSIVTRKEPLPPWISDVFQDLGPEILGSHGGIRLRFCGRNRGRNRG